MAQRISKRKKKQKYQSKTEKRKGGKKGKETSDHVHGSVELAPCPGPPYPPPSILPLLASGSAESRPRWPTRGGGLGGGGRGAWRCRRTRSGWSGCSRRSCCCTRTACRASRRGCAASSSRRPARTTPSGSPRCRSGTRASASTSPTSTSDSQVYIKGMAHDEAVATQKTGKTASPPKDQPAPWSTMQAYYGPGVLPPTYFTPAIAPGHAPPPYMWGPQPLMPPSFGTPYATMYPHVGAYPHPLVPMMANPLSMEPAKSANSKEKSSNKKLKEIDGTAVFVGSGSSKKTMSSSGDYSAEGPSDVNDLKVSKTPRKRSLDDGPGAETTTAAKMDDVLAPNHELGNTAILSNHCFPAPVIKPSVTNVANSRAMGTPISPTPGVMVSSHTGVSTELSIKDERVLKRERRKQSNRESARRSRLRKQAETEELATEVESLTAENTSLRSEINRLTESSEKLRSENSALMGKLKDTAAPNNPDASLDKTAASSSPRVVDNFLSMIDNTNKPSIGRHTEHGEPKLHQLLGSSPATDFVAAS